MGNNQSHSDSEENPYNYHEAVLREAQSGILNSASECVSEDEQYFSAEEGDSIRSITPPRTRPESSSGEDFSDNSDNNDSDNDEGEEGDNHGDETVENQNSSQAEESVNTSTSAVMNSSRLASLRSRQSCGQCNVSMYQEYDSIGPELEAARRSNNSFKSPGNNTRRSTGANTSVRSREKSGASTLQVSQINDSKTPSPFVPIQPSQSLSNTSVRSAETVPSSGKRKVSPASDGSGGREVAVPKKKAATRYSSKRKRLGYPESSESEVNEEEEKNENKKSCKKSKMEARSVKKNRRRDRDSRDRGDSASDSGEKRYGKKRKTRSSRRDYDSESEDTDDRRGIRGRRYSGKRYKGGSGRRRSKSSDSSSDDSEERYRSGKRRRSDRVVSDRSYDQDVKETKSRSRRRNKRKDISDEDSSGDSDKDSESPIPQSPPKKTQGASNDSTSNVNTPASESQVASQPCHTFKMGTQSLRNAHGKIFPLRHQSQMNVASSISQSPGDGTSVRQSTSNTSALDNIISHLRPRRSSAFVVPDSISLKRKARDGTPDSAGDNVVVGSPGKTKQTSQGDKYQETAAVNDEHQEPSEVSPLRNVVLTPPSMNGTKDSSGNDVGHISDMEVEDSDVAMETNTSQNPPSQSSSHRVILQGKRRGRTTAERFRNFWSEKKKNIGSNLRSLFSKGKSPLTKSSDDNTKTWQSYLSTSDNSQNSSYMSRSFNSANSPASFTHYSSNGIQRSLMTSSPQNQSPLHQLRSARQQKATGSSPFSNNVSPIFSASSLPSSFGISGQKSQAAKSTNQTSWQLGGAVTHSLRNSSQPNTRSGNTPTRLSPRLRSGSSIHNQRQSSRTDLGNSLVEILPQTSQFQALHCRLASSIEVSIDMGDIGEQSTSGIVNWTDGALTHLVTDCSKSVAAKAGALMRAGCNDYIENKGSHLEAPDVLTTPAGGRFSRSVEAILHVVAPVWVDGDENRNRCALLEVYANCLRFADERLGLSSISFPLIGEGTFPADMCIQTFFDALLIFLAEHSSSLSSSGSDLTTIQLIIKDAVSTDFAAEYIQSRIQHINQEGLDSIVAETYNHYFGQSHFETLQNAANERSLSLSSLSADEINGTDRAASGRPRTKRPRL